MKKTGKKVLVGVMAVVMMILSSSVVASASSEGYESGAVVIYMDTENRAYWSERYVSAYDRHFSAFNYATSGSTVNVLGQSNRPDTGWITQDYWSLIPGTRFTDYYTYAKTTSQWRVHLRTVTNRYDSYAFAYMYA